MLELKNSGLPIYLNEENNILALSAPLRYDEFKEKFVKQMIGLFADEKNLDLSEKVYDVYRGIRYPEDEDLLNKKDFRYDITIIMDGSVNGECKKTSGHFHGFNSQRTNTYPEVYEVIHGSALYVLQKGENFEHDFENIILQDVVLAVVEAGQSIIIPPNYGHCSINIGQGSMVFSNLAYVSCPVHYDAVQHYHGMSYYVVNDDNKIEAKLNDRYANVPKAKFARVKENKHLGIQFGLPVYKSYQQNPDAFDFLGNPDPYVDEILSMLDYTESL